MHTKCKIENHYLKWCNGRMSGLEEKLVESRRNTGVCELGEVKGDETWNDSLRLLQYVTYTICYICLFIC